MLSFARVSFYLANTPVLREGNSTDRAVNLRVRPLPGEGSGGTDQRRGLLLFLIWIGLDLF
jgi:hypothetical protein